MSELFDIPPQLSPRLKWMDKHGIWTQRIAAECTLDRASMEGYHERRYSVRANRGLRRCIACKGFEYQTLERTISLNK
tara:strand:+ start:1328 stop:1561 length:234 start_codon:yes stop_codon:yes gene_type:complete